MALQTIPVGEARELHGRERHQVLVEYFGMPDDQTRPLPLDELPAGGFTLVEPEPSMYDMLLERLGPRWRRRAVPHA